MPCGENAGPGGLVQAASPHGGSSEALNCGSRVMVSLLVSNSAKEPGRRPSGVPIWLISSVCPSGSSSMSSGLLKLQVGFIPPAGTQPLTGGNFSPQPPSSASAMSNIGAARMVLSHSPGRRRYGSVPWRCRPAPAREQQAVADGGRREFRTNPYQ